MLELSAEVQPISPPMTKKSANAIFKFLRLLPLRTEFLFVILALKQKCSQ